MGKICWQPASRPDGTQRVTYTGTAGTSIAFGAQTYQIRVVASSACWIAIGQSPTADNTFPLLPANSVEYLTVTPGQKISAVEAGTNGLITATDGTLWVTEIN